MDHFFQIRGVGPAEAEIEKIALNTVKIAPGASAAMDVAAECRTLARAGIQHCIFNMPNVHEIEPVRIFGREIIPAVHGL